MKKISDMIHKYAFYAMAISICCMISAGCNVILEDDISKEKVVLYSPHDNLSTINPTQTFSWYAVEGATSYNLMVVSPSFGDDEIESIVLDTNLANTNFSYTLSPGVYQWGVLAFNGSSNTPRFYYNLTIDTTSSLSTVILIEPLQNFISNAVSVKFKWQEQDNADSYRFELLLNDNPIYTTLLLKDFIEIPKETSELTSLPEGNYTWKVQAQSSTANPSTFSSRNLMIDRTAPQAPTLTSPNYNEALTGMVTLTWQRKMDDGSLLSDSLQVSTDSLFNELSLIENEIVTSQSYDFTPTQSTLYFWRVKTFDEAGNSSAYKYSRFNYSTGK